MSQMQIPVTIPGSKNPFRAPVPAPVVQPESIPAVGGAKHPPFDLKVSPPRVPCITLNAFAFPVKDTVVEKIFDAIGGRSLVKEAGGKFSHSSFNSLSVFFCGGKDSTNHVFVACHNGLCSVEFRKFSGPRFELVGSYDHIQLSSLSALFSNVTGLQFNKN